MFGTVALVILGLVAWAIISVLLAMSFRTVVKTNEVHTVQTRRKTVAYGKDQAAGNVYYAWPAWLPRIGIRVIVLPVSVFDARLNDYPAYDQDRVPFVLDIMAFFRIDEPSTAAQRVSSFQELKQQLDGILQGATRSILAQAPINEILQERAKYGKMFTDATTLQLKSWGVVNVKNIELMDIRDTQGSASIKNIMAKKQSFIEMESRTEVAKNQQAANTAEINAKRQVLVCQQEAEQAVGIQTATKTQAVGIADQTAAQQIKVQEAVTAEKAMAVTRVNQVKQAEITRDAKVVQAEQEKQVAIREAEGRLGAAQNDAQAIEVQGKAKGAAEQAVLMAPVNSQIALAKEIGTNENYQHYLVTVRQIEANQVVGIEQAKALEAAHIKVIANSTAGPVDGVKSVMDLFTPKGGTQVGAALEAFKNTEAGDEFIRRITGSNGKDANVG
jgi:flotillin